MSVFTINLNYISKEYVAILRRALRDKCPYSELFWSAFSCIWTEYREIQSICKYSVQMQENADQNNSEYEHLSSSEAYILVVWRSRRSSHLEVFLRKVVLTENMQLIYRRTPMPKCDFNKVAKWRFHLQNTSRPLLQ